MAHRLYINGLPIYLVPAGYQSAPQIQLLLNGLDIIQAQRIAVFFNQADLAHRYRMWILPKIIARRTVLEADRKSTRLNSSHVKSSYAVFCLKKKSRT